MADQGFRVRGVTLLLWGAGDRRSCCSPDAVQRARESAAALALPFDTLDRRQAFTDEVVEPFVAGYLGGETPNPCVACNPGRLAALVDLADELGYDRVATGHYARVVWRGERPFVARGADSDKDQSYMLARVTPETLARLEFPLGEMTKTQTRERAAQAELAVADEPESQEVCFATSGYRAFFATRGIAPTAGDIVDSDGRVIGSHDGQWWFTVGQRRGLRLSGPEPLYVVARLAAENVVVAGTRDELAVLRVELRDVDDRDISGDGLTVQLRYKSAPVAVERLARSGDKAMLTLAAPFFGVAPGQVAVLYRDDVVVGSGVVCASAGEG
jgi:tRNA-uridine 2-sulfurtransferase